jgi:hypothetical protein
VGGWSERWNAGSVEGKGRGTGSVRACVTLGHAGLGGEAVLCMGGQVVEAACFFWGGGGALE